MFHSNNNTFPVYTQVTVTSAPIMKVVHRSQSKCHLVEQIVATMHWCSYSLPWCMYLQDIWQHMLVYYAFKLIMLVESAKARSYLTCQPTWKELYNNSFVPTGSFITPLHTKGCEGLVRSQTLFSLFRLFIVSAVFIWADLSHDRTKYPQGVAG